MTDPSATKTRTRRAEPIDKRTAKNGTVTYTFQVDVGAKPDGTRDRQRFTYRTFTEARREYRRITTEVAEGKYIRLTNLTVDEGCDEWLKGRRKIRRVTLSNYTRHLLPVRRFMGGKKLAQLTKADGDALVAWMLTKGRVDQRLTTRPDSLASRIAAFIAQHSEGISTREIRAEFPGKDIHTSLSALVRAGRIARTGRAMYTATELISATRGVKPVTVRSTLTALGAVVQSYVDQGALPRNVIALVERPSDEIPEDDDAAEAAKSWTVAEVERFREEARGHRLHACWLLSTYGARRSEVLGMRWTRFEDEKLKVRRGRVAIGTETEESLPKSRRSRRDLPPPADLADALRALKTLQKAECLALGIPWSDDRLIAVHEDGTPVRPEWYSDEFQRISKRAGLRRIPLKGLRNTSVSLMLALGIPVHIVAAWHGHDPAVALSIYSDAQPEDLKAAGAALFG
ncbi:site-specific integrase [Nocardia terpenica]|uniref:Integrase n=1 Tax=Nocardia terpenica TaxID=455432 RepID=A0A164HNY2_9NOCA|nr:site-specific integrase [Nocardia terpenica]KZM68672.1 integrase [Nocardia terpenica]NQE88334.1 site-specific integrase [Nocardia terpenica]